MVTTRSHVFLFSVVLLVACGGGRVASPDDVITLEEMRIVASGGEDGERVFESYDAGQLFERGTALLNQGECRRAVDEFYDRIADEFPTSRYVGAALYNAGLCLQQGGDHEAAVPYFQALLERVPDSRDARHGALQLAHSLVRLERWADARALADRALLREDLEPHERLELLARRAQALLGEGSVDEAERQARDALSYYRRMEHHGQVQDPYFAAAANYVLAETMRLRAEAMAVPEGTAEEQHAVLDRRARLLLDAQREYFDTIRHTNAEWASAAGYRIGAMYDSLWQAMRAAPIPPPTREMNEATEALYREEYRAELGRHIEPLMRHAIRYWELTLLMIERTGVRSEWTDRTREDLERMRSRLMEETAPEAPADERGDTGDDSVSTLRLPGSLLRGATEEAGLALADATAPTPLEAPARAFAAARLD